VILGTPPGSATVGQAFYYQPRATDADGDRLSFWIRNQPSWARFDSRSGALSGTPLQPGTHSGIEIGVKDFHAEASLPPFTLEVVGTARIDQPPVIGGSPPGTVVAEHTYAFQPNASDPEGARLSFAIQNRPAWANFEASNGRLSGTPTSTQVGMYGNIVISATDGTSFASLAPFAVEVSAAPNTPPVISGSPATQVTAGQAYSFTPVAQDADGDQLSFSASNKPAWASFDTATGRLSGTPTQVGATSNVVITVSDGQSSASLPAFSIEVTEVPNRAPAISGSPPTAAAEGQPYSFAPSASDPDGDTLVFSIQNRPTWASFNTSSGRLTGTPGSTHVSTYSGIVISVSDGKVSAALPSFSISVAAAPNRAPILSGSAPTTALVGELYTFAPSASDPDGDPLTFSIAGKPTWASFNAATGRLSGTPGSGDTGFIYNIVISASDGEATTSLPSFNVRVDQPAVRSVTLSWQAPTRNEDGSTLTNLTGYEVHYGQSPGQYTLTLPLPSTALTSVTIEDLTPATWYFAVKAVNSAGVKSSFSNEAWKAIN
jgi:hypothetical protein